MKQKFLLLANSITFQMPLMIHEMDFTNSYLDDDEIMCEIDDQCAEYEQAQYHVSVLTEQDVAKLRLIINAP